MATRARLFIVLLFALGCGSNNNTAPQTTNSQQQTEQSASVNDDAVKTSANMSPVKIEKMKAEHLPNPVRVHARVISGGLPEGDAAFAELKALGIKTVISVDGAKPDLVTAQKHGLEYVHLPHGYDGVPEERAKELAKAVRDLPGPIYIHCHHGKHRSPAAAAVACVGAGFINHDESRQVLAIAGTGENYRGLFQSADDAKPLDASLLDGMTARFPETAKLPAMAEAMVAIEHVLDHLKLIEKAGWNTPADHPALAADHESLLLREHFTELLRTDDVKGRPEQFRQLIQEAETLCLSLEEALKTSPIDTEAASKTLAAVATNCKSCHQVYRDVPGAMKRPTKSFVAQKVK